MIKAKRQRKKRALVVEMWEMAELWGFTVGYISRLNSSGKFPIPHQKLGTHVYYLRADVDAYFKVRTLAPIGGGTDGGSLLEI